MAEKPKTVLAALLLAGNRVVSDAYLREVTWGPTPPATVDQQLFTYVSRLRKLLSPGATILRRRPGYQLVRADAGLDHAEFERLAGLGNDALKAHRHAEASEHLATALALWHGPTLAGVTEHLSRVELPGSKRRAWPHWRVVSPPTSLSAATTRSCPNSSAWWRPTRCGSGCAPS